MKKIKISEKFFMANRKSGLGRGYDALFTDNSTETIEGNIQTLSLSEISPNKDQPRKVFRDDELHELADSIAKIGLIQPIVVRPGITGGYIIVAGERRWRACRIAGLTEVPVIVKSLTDDEAAVIALVENLQREDLNPIEAAMGYKKLMDDFNITQDEASERVGKSRSSIANTVRLLNLPDDVKNLVSDGLLQAGAARALLGLTDGEKIVRCAKIVIDNDMSVRETEALVRSENIKSSQPPRRMKPLHKDIFFSEVELAIRDKTGRDCSVKEGKKGGKLVIEFFDKEDLAKLAKMLED